MITQTAPMIGNELREHYQARGYALGPRLLDQATISALTAELDRIIETGSQGDPACMVRDMGQGGHPVWQCVNVCRLSPVFGSVVFSPVLAELAATLSGTRELRLWHDQIQYKPTGTGGVNHWHQDGPYWPCLANTESMVTAWIALDDADVDNGCMHMVPASHQWGNAIEFLQANRSDDFHALPEHFGDHAVSTVPCPVPAGHVHFHHTHTWHGSPANTSARPRRALAVHFLTERVTRSSENGHMLRQLITSEIGEPIRGEPFPLLWSAAD